MINFFIYDKDNEVLNIYKKILLKLTKLKKIDYSINIMEDLNSFSFEDMHSSGKKIYLINIDSKDTTGIKFIKNIRENGDWISQIIVTSQYNNNINIPLYRLLILDCIAKTNNFINNVYDALKEATNILISKTSLNFKTNNEVFQILYDDICYIEKNLNDNDSTVFTKNNSYTIKCSINKLLSELNSDSRFFKTHRSCIVNLNNITCFDMKKNIIKFNMIETNLISRNNRKLLKDKILEKNGML